MPIVESFIIVDTWPDLLGFYLHISSCVPFEPATAIEVVEKAGLRVTQHEMAIMRIDRPSISNMTEVGR